MTPAAAGPARLATLAVGALFFGGGCAALIYEVVWFQLLRTTVGASSISLALTLIAFMGGLGLGAWLAQHLPARWRPLHLYAAVEVAIGALGLAMPWVVPWVTMGYAELFGVGGMWALLGRAAVCGLVLLPPTVLMGMTLPVLARWFAATPRGVGRLSWLYAANTAGAVTGTLLAGFVLMRLTSLDTATAVAAGLNLAVAAAAFGLAFAVRDMDEAAPQAEDSKRQPQPTPRTAPVAPADGGVPVGWVLATIAMSGATALGAQVLWTRVLSVVFGVTVYTFAIILAVFLLGLAIGKVLGGGIARRTRRPAMWLGLCQAGLVLAIVWAYHAISQRVPRMEALWWRYIDDPWQDFAADLTRTAYAILPATILWGASFALAVRAAGWGRHASDAVVARVLAANTAGAIVGTMVFSFVGLGVWGSSLSAKLLTATAGAAGVVMIALAARHEPRPELPSVPYRKWRLRMSVAEVPSVLWLSGAATLRAGWAVVRRPAGAIVLGFVLMMLATLPTVPDALIVGGRYARTITGGINPLIDHAEGVAAPVGVSRQRDGDMSFWVSGKIVASSLPEDMRLQRMLGHLAALKHGEPRSVLIVGLGTGMTAGSFVLYPSVERIVICEIEPRVAELAELHFAHLNHDVLNDPRTQIVYDDARHFLATTDERFDIITSDPIHPWVKGAAALYSREYYDLVQDRLNPGGVVTQWVPFYETNREAIRSMIGTFCDAFPSGTIWHAGYMDRGNDVVMLAQPGKPALDLDALAERLDARPAIVADLVETDIKGFAPLAARYTASADDLGAWLDGARINRDRAPTLEYLAGLSIDEEVRTAVLLELRAQRTWPPTGAAIDPSRRRLIEALMKP
ncbi:MAG: fused MFS/spermidine synthase [Planctomycetota bacterium]